MNRARPNGIRNTTIWLTLWLAVAVIGSWAIRNYADHERLRLTVALANQSELLASKNRNELNILEQDLRQKSRDAAARRQTDLEKVWGGAVAAAFKNPAFSLREALQHAAEACAPTNTFVRAEVDRFTEFVVTIDSPETISTNQMIAVARNLIPTAKEYLAALRFSTRGTLIAEIDRSDIEFVDDWAGAPDRRIAMLLPRESESRIAQDPAAVERLRNEQRIGEALAADPPLRENAERADRNLRQTIQNAYGELNLALESLAKSVAFNDVQSVKDLDRCDQELRAAIEHADRARSFWSDPVKEWKRLLETEGVSGELKDVLVKNFPAMFRNDPAKTAKIFETVSGQIESCRYTLRLLTSESEKWKFSGGGIALIDDEFARKFERAQHQIREDFQSTEAALRAWHESIGP
jgi:hypothetical protein